MKSEIKFNKYRKRGAYHWQQISSNPFRFNAFVAARYRQVVAAIPKKTKQKILDIGSGDGVLPWLIYKKTKAQITGIDTDTGSLEAGREKLASLGTKIKLIEGNAYKLPFTGNFFDVVVAAEVIEHLRFTNNFLKEVKRVLKPGGKIIITTPVKLSDFPEDKMHIKEFLPKELEKQLARYFSKVKLTLSHPEILKRISLWRLVSLGNFHLEPGRLLISVWVLLTGINPFLLPIGKSSNQLVVGCKPK